MKRLMLLAGLALLGSCATATRERPWHLAAWKPLATGTSASLRGVCVLDGGIVWASGSGGTVLRSTDGGATWSRFQIPGSDKTDVRDVEALDAQRAWVIAITEPARVLRTEDGGNTWTVVHESADPRAFYDSIALFEGGGGVVFGDPRNGVFDVLVSRDGERWTHVSAASLPPAREGEAAFAASGTCVVTHGDHAWIGTGGRHARVLRTSTRGSRWAAAETPLPQGGQTTGIYGVTFRDARHGIVIGGDYKHPKIGGSNAAWTADGGRTWETSAPGPSGYRSACAFLPGSPHAVVAVGRGGADLSLDGGRSWAPFGDGTGYYAVDASSDGTVIAVGAGGRAARLVLP